MLGYTDAQGLVPDNNYMVIYIPASKKAFVHRVVDRVNVNGTVIDYGALPLTSGNTMPTYDGSTATIPAAGVLPARAYSRSGSGLRFPLANAYDANDMFYTPDNYGERLTHVIFDIFPAFTRLDWQIPTGADQGSFQNGNVSTSISSLLGALPRGRIEAAFLPEIVYGLMVGNDTNLDLYTGVKMTYGEYNIESPKNPQIVLDILSGQRPAAWMTLPIQNMNTQMQSAFRNAYGYEGFPIYPRDFKDDQTTRAQILAEYSGIIRGMKI